MEPIRNASQESAPLITACSECPTSHPERVEFAHLLRGIAAASVVVHHFSYMIWNKPQIIGSLIAIPTLPALVSQAAHVSVPDFSLSNFWGHFGVALFFLISGFVIPFSVSALTPYGFLVARLLRIWPTYVVGFTIALACLTFNVASRDMSFPYAIGDVLSHYLILPRWPTLAHPIDGIIWTLEIEVFFYVFCFLANARIKNFDRSIYLIAAASAPVGLVASWASPGILASGWPFFPLIHWASSMMQFLPFLLVGTACHYYYRGRLRPGELAVLHLTLLTAFVLSWRFGVMYDGWSTPFSYLVAYAAFAAAFTLRVLIGHLPRLVGNSMSRLAQISYPLYVVHAILGYSVIAWSLEAGLGAGPAVGLAIAVTAALASVLHVTVERPSQIVGKTLARDL